MRLPYREWRTSEARTAEDFFRWLSCQRPELAALATDCHLDALRSMTLRQLRGKVLRVMQDPSSDGVALGAAGIYHALMAYIVEGAA